MRFWERFWVHALELREGHDGAEDVFLRDLHVLLVDPSERACVRDRHSARNVQQF
jgi:hypothetical protein